MKAVGRLLGLSFLAVCANTSANDVGQFDSKREVVTKPAKLELVETPEYSPTQVVCLKLRRSGSRVVENKCQTIAQWKQHFDEKAMRQHMIRAQGSAASWETKP